MSRSFRFVYVILFSIFFAASTFVEAQVAIGTGGTTPTPNSSAVLLLIGDGTQGLIIPTITNINTTTAIGKAGMVAFSNGKVYYSDGSAWNQVGGGSAASLGLRLQGNVLSLDPTGTSSIGLSGGTAPTSTDKGKLFVWDGTQWTTTPTPNAANQILKWDNTNGVWFLGTDNTGAATTVTATAPLTVTGTATAPVVNFGGWPTNAAGVLTNNGTGSLSWGSAALPSLNTGQIFVGNASNIAAATAPNTFPLSNFGAAAASVSMGSNKITNVATPTSPTDAANKSYVDANVLPSLSASQLLSNNGTNTGITVAGDLGLSVTGTTGTFTIANNAVTNTKLATGIDATKITTGTLPITQVPNLDATKITTGTFTSAQIPNLDASKIASGTLSVAQVPNLDASKITTGTLPIARIAPSGTNGDVLTTVGGTTIWQAPSLSGAAGGDLTGTYPNPTISTAALTGSTIITAINNSINVINGSRVDPTFGTQTISTNNALSVGPGGLFSVNSSGNITKINGATTSFPASNLAGVLTNNGSGILTWTTISGGGNMISTNNLSDVSNIVTARTNLGLGSLSTLSSVTTTEITDGTIAGGDLASNIAINTTGAVTAASFTGSATGLTGFPTLNQNTTGNAATATALATGRTISLTGDVNYTSPAFDGSGNVTAASTVTRINGTSLSGLSTGILKNTTGTGVPSIATGADLPVMTATVGGAVPTPPNNTTTFLRGDGTFATPAGGGTVTNIATGTGLTGGPITGSGTISLANTAVTPASYGTSTSVPQITVDAQGRLTGASNVAIPTANTTTTGLLSGADWTTFNSKQDVLTLTTTGTSGAATILGTTLNIPNYAGASYSAGTGLTLTTNTFSVNTSQNIATLSNLSTNGLIKTSGGTGALSIATSGTDYAPATAGTAILKGNGTGGFSNAVAGTDYLTTNQTVTLSGDITGSGTTAIATAIGASKVTNTMLAGSIAASKLVGTDIATVGTITAGAWNGTKISEVFGGTNQATYAPGDILYASASNTLSKLAVGANNTVLTVAGGVPTWAASSAGWGLTGNPGTNPATNFIGTTDVQDLAFRTNNIEFARLTSAGKLGIGTNAPSGLLDVQNAGTTSYAGSFNNSNAANTSATVIANKNGATGAAIQAIVTGGAEGLNINQNGTGYALDVIVSNASSNNSAIIATHNGPGNVIVANSAGTGGAAALSITNAASPATALTVATVGTGSAATFTGGNVGIGTTTPKSKLQIGNSFTLNDNAAGGENLISRGLYFDGTTYRTLGTNASSALLLTDGRAGIYTFAPAAANAVVSGPSARLNIIPAGIGVNVDTPIETFQVNGATYLNQITTPSTTTDRLYNVGGSLFWNGTNISSGGSGWGLSGNALAGGEKLGSTNGNPLTFITNNANRMTIDPTGNVGVGTTSPTATLDVVGVSKTGLKVSTDSNNPSEYAISAIHSGTSDVAGFFRASNPAGGTNSHGIFTVADGQGAGIYAAAGTGGTGSGGIFSNFNASNPLPVVQIFNSGTGPSLTTVGRVGIATSTPTEALDVVGNLKFSGAFMPNNLPGTSGQVLTSAGAGLPPTWSAAGSGWGLSGNAGTNPATNFIGTTDAQPLRFATGVGGVERMRIDATGNVGIGVTTPEAKLDVAGNLANNLQTIFTRGVTDAGFKLAASNGVAGGAGTKQAEFGMYYTGNGYGSSFSFYRGSASLDGSIGLNTNSLERMRIDATGNVGIGTTTPSQKLDVNGSVNIVTNGILKFGGVDVLNTGADANNITANMRTIRNAGSTSDGLYIGLGNSGGNAGHIRFYTNGTQRMHMDANNGMIGINTTSPQFPLDIAGGAANFIFTTFFNTGNGGSLSVNENQTPTIAVRANGGFLSQASGFSGGFYVSSDERIKKKIGISKSANDLELLMKLRVTNYKMKDSLNAGAGIIKGVIAQEVEEVYPQAISKQTNFIPNIYSSALALLVDETNKTLTVSVAKPHDLKVGNKVKLISSISGEKQSLVIAVSTNSFTVADWSEKSEKIFVYGKEVNDFRIVDYDRLFTLNLSATQELNKKLETQQKVIDSLHAQDAQNKKKIATLEASLSKVAAGETELATLKSEIEKIKAALGISASLPAQKEEKGKQK